MNNLMKFEFRKLFKQKSFYICTAVMLGMSLIGLLLNKALASNPDFTIVLPTASSAFRRRVSQWFAAYSLHCSYARITTNRQ